MEKNELFPVGREEEDVDGLASEFYCKLGLVPSMWLGLPLGAFFKAKSIWDLIVERLEKCLIYL